MLIMSTAVLSGPPTHLPTAFPTSASFYTGEMATAYGYGEENNGFKAFTAYSAGGDCVHSQYVFGGGQSYIYSDH